MSKNLSNQLVVTWTCPTIKIRCPMSGGYIKFLTMAPLPAVIEEFIIKTNEKLNKNNLKVYCKPCVKVLGEIEGKKTKEIYNLIQKNTNSTNLQIGKRKEPSFSCETASIVSQGSKVIVRLSSYGTIENYIVRPLSSLDMKKFHTLLLRLSLSCGWTLHWVNKPEAEELFQFLNSHLKLPDRCLLGGHILSDAVIDSNNIMIEVLQKDPVGVTLTFDGWTNVRNEQLLGVVIITSEGHPYILKATNISSERETHIEVMEKTKEMYTELNDNGVKVCAVVTDSAGLYAASRRRLRVINRSIVFFPCFAHQVNLCVGEIFKESIEFKESMDKAIRLASFFQNSNNKFFISKLKDQQYEEYNKYFTIATPGETCILKTQKALQILAIKFEPPIRETRKRAGDEPTLKRDIYEIISSSIFWQHLKLLIEILYPYCKILDMLQSDKARLHEVIHSFGYIAQFWNENSNSDLTSRLVARLEKRWKEWEQPILIISCLLHPNYHMKIFNNANINYTTIGQHSKCILRELENFRLELYPFNLATWNQFNGDIYRYWSFACTSTNERRLRVINRSIVFFPCFAHQVNLCVGEIFKESIEFKESMDKAIRLASFFQNSNNKFFISKLKDQQYEEYNKYFTIATPGETCILKTQKALQILAIKFEPPIRETRKRAGDEPTLKRDIYEIISSSIFWQHLKLLIEILYPYCKILDMLQSDKARLHEVIHSFGYIAQFWNENSNSDLTSRLVARLEKRWKEWEQPILIISCLLHPNYHMKIFNNANINYTTIATWNQFNGDIYRYWSFACTSTNEFGFVACRVFGICVNAASVERLWSCMGFLQSNRRNRLLNAKALEMSKLRADITYSHRLQKKVSEITPQTIISEIELSRCYETEEIVINENKQTIEQGDVEIPSYGSQDSFLSEEIDDMDELEEINDNEAENITHPAIVLNAKWELSTLFNKLNLPF
ncbi:hypothetical protein Glove_390g69 [Diversispora epigaea]|uniref:DUF659 domain-containing protein n=1 Tax=Diversispora epigaea TaxID=1348612 RepID=A0A397H7F3_9GLOM|nr:hypothetical protein Glove_390g69 [Diversispora epigaea]